MALAVIGTNTNPLRDAPGFSWPVVAILFALVAFFVIQMARLAGQPNPRRLRESLVTPIFLAAASVLIGCLGTGITMYRSLMEMASNPEGASSVFSGAIISCTAGLAISLLVALCAGVAWFVLAGRIIRLEDEAAKALSEVK